MKRSTKLLAISLVICADIFFGLSEVFADGPVRVDGRRLMVDFDNNGIYEPYQIKAVGYQPVPIGQDPQIGWEGYDALKCDRDFPLIRTMNANSIRTWDRVNAVLLQKASEYRLAVCAGFWFSNYTNPDEVRLEFSDYVQETIEQFPDPYQSPLLIWCIGNENNYWYPGNISDLYDLLEDLAQIAHNQEDVFYGSHHPVAIVNGDIYYIGNVVAHADDASLTHVDIWAVNLYRGYQYGDIFAYYAGLSQKPMFISEFGIDAYDYGTGQEDQLCQADWVGRLWDEINRAGNICIGGSVMAYSDEWWKMGSASIHNTTGWDRTTAGPDATSNEEWYGIMSVSDNPIPGAPDIMSPRQAYYVLRHKFYSSQ